MVRSTGRATALGARIRATREAAGISQRALDKRLGWGTATTSRIETGERPPDPDAVVQILDMLGVTGEERAEILELAQDSGVGPTWFATTLPELQAQVSALLELEQRALQAVDISPLVVPGLLQTRDYARAVMQAAGVPREELEPKVSMRIGRREVLTRRKPVELTAVIGERVLRDRIGGQQVMVEQLDHLLMMSRLPNVDLRILPDGIGWTPSHIGSFYLLQVAPGTEFVYIELLGSAIFLEEDDVAAYRRAVERVLGATMSTVQSTELIERAAEEIRGPIDVREVEDQQSQ